MFESLYYKFCVIYYSFIFIFCESLYENNSKNNKYLDKYPTYSMHLQIWYSANCLNRTLFFSRGESKRVLSAIEYRNR